MTVPTYARVSSLTHWNTFFHPTSGLFRLPSTHGTTIEHLDIDLRFVEHEHDNYASTHLKDAPGVTGNWMTPHAMADVYLPNVAVITLRGAEHCHDHEERMDALAEVLLAIKPIEVRWLNATSDPAEQLTFSTHLVHPGIIAAGDIWARNGGAKKIVIQAFHPCPPQIILSDHSRYVSHRTLPGGFPCPNLSAPTPFSLTPAATPCPSPGPTKTSFGSAVHSLSTLSAIPALSTTKPKPVSEEKLKERAERRRLAEYTLKPRFEFAFGSWGAEVIEWRFDGRYTPACILASIEHLFNALSKSFPYASTKADSELPALLSIAPLPTGMIIALRGLVDKLDMEDGLVAFLTDTVFFATKDESAYARVFEGIADASLNKGRQADRLKAEMLLLQSKAETSVRSDSMSESTGSLMPGETYASTEDEGEAQTPDMIAVDAMIPGQQVKGKGQQVFEAESPSASMII